MSAHQEVEEDDWGEPREGGEGQGDVDAFGAILVLKGGGRRGPTAGVERGNAQAGFGRAEARMGGSHECALAT
jgi:hypothetical protein